MAVRRKKLSDYQKQDSVKQEFLSRKRQADHLWAGIIIRIEFGESITHEEIAMAMGACNQADIVCLKEGYLRET